jgi:hypothetical protein
MEAKEIVTNRPMKGWMTRVHGPPPKSWVRGQKNGWKKARPERARRIKQMAVSQ